MHFPSQLRYVFSGSAAFAVLAGCSGAGAGTTAASGVNDGASTSSIRQPMVGSGTSVLRPDISERIGAGIRSSGPGFDLEPGTAGSIALSDIRHNAVDIFDMDGNQTAKLTGFFTPQGIAADTLGNLYVANTGASNIDVYQDFKGSPRSLSDPGQYPASVAVDSKGNIGVTNITLTSGGPGSVTFYSKSGKMGATIGNSSFARVYFDGFDQSGNLYIDGTDSSGNVVVGEIVGGVKSTSITLLATGNTIQFPGGVNVDINGNICIEDQANPNVYCYAAPKKGSLGMPVSTTRLSSSSDPVTYAFTNTDKHIYTADAGLSESLKFNFPAGGSPIMRFSAPNFEPVGIAINPAQTPEW